MNDSIKKLRPARYRVGQTVRAVKGPGGALQPEPQHLGKHGTIMTVQAFTRSCACYVVDFGDDRRDTIDETCLEKAQ